MKPSWKRYSKNWMTITLRCFDMKKLLLIIIACLAGLAADVHAVNVEIEAEPQMTSTVDDYRIIKDEMVDGVRCIIAAPSAQVCSRQIDIRIKDGIIQEVVYTRGCDGNAKGIGALIKGMSVEEAVRRLSGITCGRKSTSCPDQLARILKSLK